MRSVFFSFVFLTAFSLSAQAGEIMLCVSQNIVFPETQLNCTKNGKNEGFMTTLKKLYKENWKIAVFVKQTPRNFDLYYLEKD